MKQYTLCVTNSPEIYCACKKLYSETRYIKFALGYNPQVCSEMALNRQTFLSELSKAKYIGEVGLDFSSKHIGTKIKQVDAFEFICRSVAGSSKLLTVHSRNAEKDVFNIMVQNEIKRAIIHWYTGDLENMQKFIRAGYYFSVNSNMCMTSRGKRIISEIPLDKILVESDGPFTKVGTHKYKPVNLRDIYSILAATIGVQNIENIVYENFNRLLTL
jgi:TatD DNase family protein